MTKLPLELMTAYKFKNLLTNRLKKIIKRITDENKINLESGKIKEYQNNCLILLGIGKIISQCTYIESAKEGFNSKNRYIYK